MSTFDGRVIEFPDIRIDYFRVSPKETTRPLAFFLSHVHSDHLQGLESCKSPFIYCTPATKQILLRLEKYPHRMNFAKGILESRKQTYRHLKFLLKAIPLETPTTLELAPGRSIRVTLFDANHCTGACVFLIEDESHAIMYTGDIRSEQWWVDSLVRQPLLIPYACRNGADPIKRLDCIYLDSTFATDMACCRRFASKKEGLSELLEAVAKYPSDTVFYIDSWTFGYEEVWVALSGFLRSQIHVDDYRYGLYNALSLTDGPQSNERNTLMGFKFGNHYQEGCLTRNQTRLHSCEWGTNCEVFEKDFVRITPIITRYEGVEYAETGIGGGQGDLDQKHELELDDQYMLQALIAFCRDKLHDRPALLEQTESLLLSLLNSDRGSLVLDPNTLHVGDAVGTFAGQDDVPIEALIPAIVKMLDERLQKPESGSKKKQELRSDGLSKRIGFPYPRHSSYEELRFVIEAFRPKEIYPCTVNQDEWTENDSMEHLFADLYPPGKTFNHDEVTRRFVQQRKEIRRLRVQRSREQSEAKAQLAHKSSSPGVPQLVDPVAPLLDLRSDVAVEQHGASRPPSDPQSSIVEHNVLSNPPSNPQSTVVEQRGANTPVPNPKPSIAVEQCENASPLQRTAENAIITPRSTHDDSEVQVVPPSVRKALQREAFNAANDQKGLGWSSIELISTANHDEEQEL